MRFIVVVCRLDTCGGMVCVVVLERLAEDISIFFTCQTVAVCLFGFVRTERSNECATLVRLVLLCCPEILLLWISTF